MRLKSRYHPELQLSECLTGAAGSISKLAHHSYSYWPEASVLCHVIFSTGHGVSEVRESNHQKKKKKKGKIYYVTLTIYGKGRVSLLGIPQAKVKMKVLSHDQLLRFHEL